MGKVRERMKKERESERGWKKRKGEDGRRERERG